MSKFIDLTYYKNREYSFPHYLEPQIKPNYIGIITHYVELSKSMYGIKLFELFHHQDDLKLFENLIYRHGVFFEKFFVKHLRLRIHPFFYDIDKSSFIIRLCNEYYNKNYNRRNVIEILKYDFIKITIHNFKNKDLYTRLKESEKNFSEIKKCKICKNEFKPIKFPDWVYFGTNGNISICYECPVTRNVKKEDLKILINELIDCCKFIPNAGFNPINHNFSIRVAEQNWNQVCETIFKMGITGNDKVGSDTIFKRMFGSWFKALVEAEAIPNGVLETSRGIKCIAQSGNECLSLDEMYIDNWMFEHNIKTEKEPFYPKHPIYNKSGRRRADWKVGDIFIEYFGLKGEMSYDEKTKEKIELANSLNLKLIPIFPSDLANISSKLKILL